MREHCPFVGERCLFAREHCVFLGEHCRWVGEPCLFLGEQCPFVREHCLFLGHPDPFQGTPSPWSEHRDAPAVVQMGLRELRRVLGPLHCALLRLLAAPPALSRGPAATDDHVEAGVHAER